MGHVLMENRHGLVVERRLTQAHRHGGARGGDGDAEARRRAGASRVGADKAYDTRTSSKGLRARQSRRTSPQKDPSRRSAIDGRTTRHAGYAISQRKRKRVEEIFGWLKTVGLMRKTRHRGRRRVGWMFTFALAAYNIVRLKNLGWGVT